MDIEAALAGPRETGVRSCRLGRWLAEIPADAPGRAQLELMLSEPNQNSPHWRTLEEIDLVLRRLDFYTSNKTVANHRNKLCRCYA